MEEDFKKVIQKGCEESLSLLAFHPGGENYFMMV